jgi:hypothetical protein
VHPECIALPIMPLAVKVLFSTAPQAKLIISILKIGFSSSTILEITALPHSMQLFPNFLGFFMVLSPQACLLLFRFFFFQKFTASFGLWRMVEIRRV